MTGVLVVVVVLALVAMLGAHVALLVLLVMRPPRYRAVVALAVPPLAPYWGWQGGSRRLASVWGAGLVLYVVAAAVIKR
jgi:hypothetical protein